MSIGGTSGVNPEVSACRFCGGVRFSRGQLRATGGWLSSIFDVQTNRFDTVTCEGCGHTELFKARVGTGMKILDFLTH